jgi:hypothetical protein
MGLADPKIDGRYKRNNRDERGPHGPLQCRCQQKHCHFTYEKAGKRNQQESRCDPGKFAASFECPCPVDDKRPEKGGEEAKAVGEQGVKHQHSIEEKRYGHVKGRGNCANGGEAGKLPNNANH